MRKVLFINPYYYPGFRSGGPQRTLMNLADMFGNRENMYILTQNVDVGQSEPYGDVRVGKWCKVGNAKVKYLTPRDFGFVGIREEYRRFPVVYACGLFEKSTIYTLFVHRAERVMGKRVYVAPMGVFSPGALAFKSLKKQVFFRVAKALGLFRDIIWSFTSQTELAQATAMLGERRVRKHIIAEDVPRKVDLKQSLKDLDGYEKEPGRLRIAFLSRISPKKNLEMCLAVLNAEYEGQIEFDIYGPVDDEQYWEKCKSMMKKLPKNVKARYCGAVSTESVIEVLKKYDVFFLPTKGENYGHVIYEALAAGCVPLVSDQTPWQDLDRSSVGGGVFSLDELDRFRDWIARRQRMDGQAFAELRRNAVRDAAGKYQRAALDSGYREVFGMLGETAK